MAVFAETRLTLPDHIMLVGYFVLVLGVGVYFYRHMRGMKDYFSGGNAIPWWLSGVSFYMTSFSAFGFIIYSALAYRFGWVAVTLFWMTVPATITSVLLFAKRWRRARIDSPVEYLETRYSAGFRQLVAWQGVPVKIVDDGLKLVATGTFVSVSLGLDMGPSVFWSGLIILLYTFMGGLWAVAVTDFIQFVVMAVAMLILLPLALARLSGAGQFAALWPASVADFFTAEYHPVYVALFALFLCIHWSSINWPLIQRYYCVADEREAIKTGWLVTLLNTVGPPLMLLPAIAARQFLGDVPDREIYPLLCVELLPAGILGLMVAAMFAATMSTLSGDYNAYAGVLTNDVYRRLVRPAASQKELVLVGRLMTLLIGGLALVVAFLLCVNTGEDLFKDMVTLFGIVTAPVGVPMILGLLSRRVSNRSALAGWAAGIAAGLVLLAWCPARWTVVIPGLDPNGPYCQSFEKEIVIFAGALAVTVAVTLVSIVFFPPTPAERERIDAFRKRLATPIGQLDEDRPAAGVGGKVVSPFRVVGVSVLLIGLLILGVLPWVAGALALGLGVGFGLALAAIGAAMIRFAAPVGEG